MSSDPWQISPGTDGYPAGALSKWLHRIGTTDKRQESIALPDGTTSELRSPSSCRANGETDLVRVEVHVMTVDRPARHRRLGRRAILPLLVALIGSLPSAGAVAANNGTTIVRGDQLAAGTCPDGGYRMTGSLVGCWWIDTFETNSDPDNSTVRATGTEHFTGCLGSTCGTFFTAYTFTAKTDGPWPTSAEIHGRCHHPVIGGTGGFAGASGEISFHDVVDVSPPYYPYIGNVHLAQP